MSQSGQTYQDVVEAAGEAFGTRAEEVRRTVARLGGRYLATSDIRRSLMTAAKESVTSLSDVALLAALVSRPDLLHAEPELYGQFPTPRKALEDALLVALRSDLVPACDALVGEGQDAETLPSVAGEALAALSEIEAGGMRFREADHARAILGAGEWESPMVYGVGSPLAEFLCNNGRTGLGNDLLAAIEARDVVVERETTPAYR